MPFKAMGSSIMPQDVVPKTIERLVGSSVGQSKDSSISLPPPPVGVHIFCVHARFRSAEGIGL